MESKNPKPRVNVIGWIIIVLVAIIVGALFIYVIAPLTQVTNSPIKISINPPKPRVVESHAGEDPTSGLFAFKEGVWATVLNEGGSGSILVKATLYQGTHTYEKSQDLVLSGNQTHEFHFVFTEPSRLGDDMKFEVAAVSTE